MPTNKNEDKVDYAPSKLDYATILRRRRRGAKSFTDGLDLQVVSNPRAVLRKALSDLRKTYVVSEEFEAECLACLPPKTDNSSNSVSKTSPQFKEMIEEKKKIRKPRKTKPKKST